MNIDSVILILLFTLHYAIKKSVAIPMVSCNDIFNESNNSDKINLQS